MITRITIPVLMMFMFAALATTAEVVPTADLMEAAPLEDIERLELSPVDLAAAAIEDADREDAGLPARFAVPEEVALTPEQIGTWETLPDGNLLLWRLRIIVPDALSLNLGFDSYRLPAGGRLVLHPAEGRQTAREFTSQNNKDHGELWTPVVLTDDLVVELTLPATARHDFDLHLVHVGKGYRFFGEPRDDEQPIWCMNDVICPEGDPWRAEINSVAVYMIWGTWYCSGVMVNNTALDGTPYFLTAAHCGINLNNDNSMVVYWNYQSPTCGQQDGGSLADYQIGAVRRAQYGYSDFCLVELEDMPDPAWQVTYSGWDRSDTDALWAVGIHHPWAQEKSISFEHDPTTTTSNWGEEVPGDGTHIRVEDWDDGTTWYGSSGSPLYNQNHHIIGQCHSGYSECGRDLSDWYGRFSVSWDGYPNPNNRLSDWLDPLGLNPMTLDLYAPNSADLYVTPYSGLESQGEVGGPFSPDDLVYTLENHGASTIDYLVEANEPWVELVGDTMGSLSPGATTTVTVAIGPAAADSSLGRYDGTVSFLNLTSGSGDTQRPVRLWVGGPVVAYSWNLDTDPGWIGEGQWEHGQPMGGGGLEGGYVDPSSGYTGVNVLGYNLLGDYPNNLPPMHLTTDAIDCSALQVVTLRFWRWLNVGTNPYDQALIHVSNDSVNWTTVWANGVDVNDVLWEPVEYDLSAIADGQSTVYLRWTMGPTNEIWTFGGWNIDDIEIFGLTPTGVAGGVQTPERTSLAIPAPNPFNPRTKIQFALDRTQQVRLAVFDLRGKQVAELADQTYAAGVHEHIWDGRDVQRRAMPSGTYIVRLETESGVEARKVMLIR